MKPNQTKLEIAQHFSELSKKMVIDNITVQEIVNQAGISRQTFYYHFQDIVDLIEWVLQNRLKDALTLSLEASNSEDALKIFIHQAYENRDLMAQLRYSKNRIEVEEIFIQIFRAYLLKVVKKYPPRMNISITDMDVFLDYHTYGSIGVLMTQLNKKEVNINQLAKQMSRLLGELHDFS